MCILNTETGELRTSSLARQGYGEYPEVRATDGLVVFLRQDRGGFGWRIGGDPERTASVPLALRAGLDGSELVAWSGRAGLLVWLRNKGRWAWVDLVPRVSKRQEERLVAKQAEDGGLVRTIVIDALRRQVTLGGGPQPIALDLQPGTTSLSIDVGRGFAACVRGEQGEIACAVANQGVKCWAPPVGEAPRCVALTSRPWSCLVGTLLPFSLGYRVYVVDLATGASRVLYSGNGHIASFCGVGPAASQAWEAASRNDRARP
jgi:hypothetical protein